MSSQNKKTSQGLEKFPIHHQPDGITCGPSCLKMILTYFGFRKDLAIQELGRQMGTNYKTGTTHIEMENGLKLLNLEYDHPSERGEVGLDHLRKTVGEDGNVVLLRTLIGGGMKHWVLVYGLVGDDFRIACPGRGEYVEKASMVERIWSARNYDHFTVPNDRSQHIRAIAFENEESIGVTRRSP